MKTTSKQRNVYVPTTTALITPTPLTLMENQFFGDEDRKTLKLKDGMLDRVEQYLQDVLNSKVDNQDECDARANTIMNIFDNIPFVRSDFTRQRSYRTAYKKGSSLVSIIKYYHVVRHLKGVRLTYSVVITTDVLSGALKHQYNRWMVEVSDDYDEEAKQYFENLLEEALKSEVTSGNAYRVLEHLTFSLFPYKKVS